MPQTYESLDEARLVSKAMGLGGGVSRFTVRQNGELKTVYLPGATLADYVRAHEEATEFATQNEDKKGIIQKVVDFFIGSGGEIKSHGVVPAYVCCYVLNSEEIIEWAKSVGFTSHLKPDDFHVTVAFSERPYYPEEYLGDVFGGKEVWTIIKGGPRSVAKLGEAIVLKFQSAELTELWAQHIRQGASYDFESYQPHISISYKDQDIDLENIPPYQGDILLSYAVATENNDEGVEYEEISYEGEELAMEFDFNKHKSLDEEQKIVYGYASVSTVDGKLFVDHHDDIIEPADMVKMATHFMESVREAKAMHEGGQIGEVIHSLPLTKELAISLGVESNIEGWIIGMKVHDDAVWQRVKSGELKAFSIGGRWDRA